MKLFISLLSAYSTTVTRHKVIVFIMWYCEYLIVLGFLLDSLFESEEIKETIVESIAIS